MKRACRVIILCGLCTEKVTVEYEMGNADAADQQVEQQALAAGFVSLGRVNTAERRRHPTWACKACAVDITAGLLEAGRRVQRPEPPPSLDSPTPPDGVIGLFAGLTQEEIAKLGPNTASLLRR